MIDETNGTDATQRDSERVGFCQDCGRPLTRETVRAVGSGMFCEPCLEVRLAGTAATAGSTAGAAASSTATGAAGAVPPGVVPPGTPGANYWQFSPFGTRYPPPNGVFPPLDGSTPHPVLAGLLGLIPGVGAMYNGQFAKGIAHIVVYTVLKLMGNMSGPFEALAVLWCFYQAFEAYHTAKARREGRPLPDPFGLNNIGENLGFGSGTRGTTAPPVAPTAAGYPPGTGPVGAEASAAWAGTVPLVQPFAAAQPEVVMGTPAPGNWGSVPATPPPPMEYVSAAPVAPVAGYSQNWAAPSTTAGSASWAEAPATFAPAVTGAKVSRFPATAVWLIALGIGFLLLTLDSDRLSAAHAGPFFLAAFAVWILMRRLLATGGVLPGESEGEAYVPRVVCKLRAPALLLVTAVLLGLQTFHVAAFQTTWPVLVIAFGLLLLVERAVGRPAVTIPVPPVFPDATAAGDAAKGGR